ncbi:DsbC family protein [Hydrogenophilus thiooxidans]|uniref:DsbC family protein n=1 Tax=Hydrogenophilus thiooxidans TaxID=2820326 RepID=UPI001C223696|nr:DsbC family protein [Hydrogenophilus thiooxidans]
MKRSLVLGLVCFGLHATAFAETAEEAKVRKSIDALLGSDAVRSVRAAPMPGLYEVVLTSGELVYTNREVSHIVVGSIIDAKTRTNLTEKRLDELSRIDFSTLPLKDAIVIKKGDGSRVFASFEDPNCGFCKRLAKTLQEVDNTTQYLFLYPILGPDSEDKAKRILCSDDPAKTWQSWMVEGKTPPAVPPSCDTSVIERNVALGRQLGIGGTPTLFLRDGSRIGGFLPAEKLEERLRAVR